MVKWEGHGVLILALHLLHVWPWPSDSTCLSLHILFHKMAEAIQWQVFYGIGGIIRESLRWRSEFFLPFLEGAVGGSHRKGLGTVPYTATRDLLSLTLYLGLLRRHSWVHRRHTRAQRQLLVSPSQMSLSMMRKAQKSDFTDKQGAFPQPCKTKRTDE